MPAHTILNQGGVPIRVYTDTLEPLAERQLGNLSRLPVVHHQITAMPDVHAGRGATVGSVIPTLGAIIPAAVGVDIGCGMCAVQLSLKAAQLPDNLRGLRGAIERNVPVGFGQHKEATITTSAVQPLAMRLDDLLNRHPSIAKMTRNFHHQWPKQIGTLGGGNHFVELCQDEQENLWVMLHSGSRGIGNALGRYFISLARKDMGRQLRQLPDEDLAYLKEGSEHFEDYLNAVHWAQEYAALNRREMLRLVLKTLTQRLPKFRTLNKAINCHHNYVSYEHHFGKDVYVTRKGAISARTGELGIIPGSMGARSYIVQGKGNAAALHSSAHGAGRRMSRTEAKRVFNKADLEQQTLGIECRKDKGVLDEIPGAYKDIDEVMANQADLVAPLHTLNQLMCIKG